MTAKIHYVGKLLQPGLPPQNCELVVERRPVRSSNIIVQDAAYTVDILDNDFTIVKETSTASITHTIQASSVTPYPLGFMVGWYNGGTVDMTIAITTDTMTGTDSATGSRTLGAKQRAVVEKISATGWSYAASDL